MSGCFQAATNSITSSTAYNCYLPEEGEEWWVRFVNRMADEDGVYLPIPTLLI